MAASPHSFIPVVLGPTGSGKSALALAWAEANGALLLSADSRQFYRGLDIGTAKPSVHERTVVEHAFLDTLAPEETWTAAEFAETAWALLAERAHAQRTAVVVGGSTLHLSALVHGLSDVPPVPTAVRDELLRECEVGGLAPLVAELTLRDPSGAQRTDLANPRRVLRALEVLRHTGRPLWAFHASRRPPPVAFRVLYLRPPRAWLYPRLDARVDAMQRAGLVEEVERLLAEGHPPSAPGLNTIGYREIVDALTTGSPIADALGLVKRNTRRYAKRQYTYFDKHFADALVIDPARTAPAGAAIDRMLARA